MSAAQGFQSRSSPGFSAGENNIGAAVPRDAGGRDTALIVNEYGSEGIDDALLRESSDEVTLLGNGCLCCNTRTDLQNALRRLVADRDREKFRISGEC